MKIPTVIHNGFSFVNVHKPTSQEIKFLNETFGFSLLNLEDYLYKTQIPKIETYTDYSLVVMDIPYIQQPTKPKKERGSFSILPKATRRKRISVGEVDFFIGKDYLVVLHDEKTPQIDEIFALCQQALRHRDDFMGEGPVFLFYRLVDILVDSSLSVVNELTATIDYIDRAVADRNAPNPLEDISTTRRNIVVFQTMIKPVLPIFADLEKGNYKELNGSMTPFWSNILDHLQKIWDRLEDNRELIEGISASHESLLVVRSNEAIKVLTVLFTLTIPGTLLGTFYGMNILLPGGIENGAWMFLGPYTTFYIVISLTLLSMIVMYLYFKYKDWF